MPPQPLGGSDSLSERLVEELLERLGRNEWTAGERLPSEDVLGQQYRVSRGTVRMALKVLQTRGFVDVRHGSGTYVTAHGAVRAGLQELQSITETIREQGHEPGMEYRRALMREATADESAGLELSDRERVLALERAFLSDGIVVAFSYDTIVARLFPTDFHAGSLTGSTFVALEQVGAAPASSLATLHAVRDAEIGWGSAKAADGLYLLLDQVHFTRAGRPVMSSSTYFIEGLFEFQIRRTR